MSSRRSFWLGIAIGIVLPLIFLSSLIFNIQKPLSFMHPDAFLVNFILDHWMKVASSGNWDQLPTLPMFYGFENSLFFSDHHLMQAILALPFYIITQDIITTSNLVSVTTIILSFISMYLLAWYLTQSLLPSLLAAIIFTFNPYVSARFPDQLILFSLQFIPLIFLFLERSIINPTNKNIFFFFLLLNFQLLSSLYYAVFLTVILPLYAFFRFWQEKVNLQRFLNWGLLMGFSLFLLVVMGSTYFYSQALSTEASRPTLSTAQRFSAELVDLILSAPPHNLLYGGLVSYEFISVHSLFLGFTPLGLLFVSFYLRRNTKWLTFMALLGISLILSFGPVIQVTNNLHLVGPYQLIHAINPLFSYLRAPERFAVFVFFFLALICALTLQEILKRLSAKKILPVALILIILVLLEYWNKPWEFTTITSNQRQFYHTLKQQRINVILDLPIGNNLSPDLPQARSILEDSHYLLYSTLHQKKLFNGYTGHVPAKYYDQALLLTFNFPTHTKLAQLKKWGVEAIILHQDEYKNPDQFKKVKAGLIDLGVPITSSVENLILFDISSDMGSEKL